MSSIPARVRAFVGLGANLGDAPTTLQGALEALRAWPAIEVAAASSLYRSPPLGPQDQPHYYNAVAEIHTALAAEALLHGLQTIEQRFGRDRSGERWGPRTLDLDLLLFGDALIATPRLAVPHPGLRERAFVLYPLHEIAPALVLPGGASLADLVERVPAHGLRRVARFR